MSSKNKKYKKQPRDIGAQKNPPVRNQQAAGVKSLQQQSMSSNYKWMLLAGIAVFTFICYSYTLRNQFTNWDDGLYIESNPYIKNLTHDNLKMILFHNITNNYYHPLTLLSISANYHFSKMDPFGYYLTNVIIHVLNTCLIFFLVLTLLRAMEERGYGKFKGMEWLAVLAALCHGVHPMHVESVSWIAERKDVLYGFFYWLGLMAYIRGNKEKSNYWGWYGLVFLLYLLSLVSKPLAVIFPLSLFTLDIILKKDKEMPKLLQDIGVFISLLVISLIVMIGLVKTHLIESPPTVVLVICALLVAWVFVINRSKRLNISRIAVEKFPFFLISLVGGIWAWKMADASGSIASSHAFPIIQRVGFAGFSFTMFVLKAFIPFHQCSYYPYPNTDANGFMPAYFYAAPFTSLIILAVPLYLTYKANENYFRVALFGLGFFLVNVLFVLQFVSVGPALMPERYTSIAYFGIFFMVIFALQQLWVKFPAWRFPFMVAPGIFIAILAYLCHERTKVWHNTQTLWQNVIDQYPLRVETSYKNLGNFYAERNQYDSAFTEYDILDQIHSTDAGVYSNLANIYALRNRFGKSLEYYTKALKLDGKLFDVYLDRAITYCKMDSFALAIKDYNHAYSMDSTSEQLLVNRGRTFLNIGQTQNALTDFNHLIQINPDVPLYYLNRGIAESNLNNSQAALADFLHDLNMEPNNTDCMYNLSVVYSQMKDYTNALKFALEAKQKGHAVSDAYIVTLQQKLAHPGK